MNALTTVSGPGSSEQLYPPLEMARYGSRAIDHIDTGVFYRISLQKICDARSGSIWLDAVFTGVEYQRVCGRRRARVLDRQAGFEHVGRFSYIRELTMRLIVDDRRIGIYSDNVV